MRTVLIGSDFMYDKDGNLKPIEINTAVGWDGAERVEEDIDCLDLTALDEFIKSKNFTTIHYVGEIQYVDNVLGNYCTENSMTYMFHAVNKDSITIPYIEDNDETLIIRSAYDTTALVDDTYCRDKVNFMNLIKDSSFGSEFVYMDENNQLISNITTIHDNGEHPNFILKSRLPIYDKTIYPKFYKVTNQAELDILISNNVTADYFLMEYLYNPSFTYENHGVVIRSLNILYPPTLESIQLGQYTKLNQNMLLNNVTYNPTTFEVDEQFKSSYTTATILTWKPKLLDTDMVEMADGSFKTALELEIGDSIKTIEIVNENGDNIDDYIERGELTFETLSTSVTYSNNIIINKQRINSITWLRLITFDDESTWMDTETSKYLIDRDNLIQFVSLDDITTGDTILLLNTNNNNVDFVRKVVVTNLRYRSVFNGWFITVESAKLFLTKTSSTNNESFVTIEHNVACSPKAPGCLKFSNCPQCPKVQPCCNAGNCGGCS